MQRYTMVFTTINAVHVTGGSSAHHQEHKTVHTASGICQVLSAIVGICQGLSAIVGELLQLTNSPTRRNFSQWYLLL
jgi:hypothetical protein